MSRLIPAAERVVRARSLIKDARNLPIPAENGRNNFSYIAQIKDLLRQARDMVKFIPQSPSTTAEMRAEVREIYLEAERANTELLH